MTIVSHYGIHDNGSGVKYLHQGAQSMNFIGLDAPSPFKVVIPSGVRVCPHNINVSVSMPDNGSWKKFMKMYSEPGVREFLPIPPKLGQTIPFFTEDELSMIFMSRFSSPTYPIVHSFQSLSFYSATLQLNLTNVAPLILTNIRQEDQANMDAIAGVAFRSRRKLILCGPRLMVAKYPIVRTSLNLKQINPDLPFETFGAVALRRWARGEAIDSPWIRDDNPPKEPK